VNSSAITVTVADDNDASAWDLHVGSSEKSEVYHLFGWKQHFESVFGHDCYYLAARDDQGQTVGVLPLVHQSSRLFGNFLISVPCFNYCGILADTDQAHLALVEGATKLARELGAGHVELRHREGTALELPLRSDKVSMQLSLPDSEESLWGSFSSKLRAQIRRPQKEGAVCVSGGEELLDDFYGVFSHNMRDLGTPVFPKRMFEDILTRFPDRARVFVVRMNEKPVAAGYTLGHRDTLEIPSASSLREFNRYSPNMLLYWSILQYAVAEGFKRFKKQWGALPSGLSWHYILQEGKALPRINPDNPKYRLAVNLWRRLPVPLANLIGPQVVKHLP
jgi:FemAB-related protein (PEP-CTERM system-associated)